MTTETHRPGINAKLRSAHRVAMFRFAATRFTEPALREAAAQAKQAFLDGFIADHAATVAKDLDVLRRYMPCNTMRAMLIPYFINERIEEEKSFTLPNGETVTRNSASYRTIAGPAEPTFEGLSISTIREFAGGHDLATGKYDRVIEFGDLPMPGYSRNDYTYLCLEERSGLGFAGREAHLNWVRPETWAHLRAYYHADERRRLAEQELLRSITAIILQSPRYADVLAIWPEVAEIVDELFPVAPKTIFELVAINDEAKTKLCQNMNQRGVNSPLCSVAA